MLYRKILKQAWAITWQNKYLWAFGLFTALLGGSGEYKILSVLNLDVNNSFFSFWNRLINTGIFDGNILTNIGNTIKEDPFTFLIILFIYLVIITLVVLVVWLTIVSQVAIVNNTAGILINPAHQGKNSANKNYKDGLVSGINNFWPVFGLNIINKLIISFIIFFVALLAIFTWIKTGSMAAYLSYIISFIILVPLAVILSFIIKYAIVYIVIKGKDLIDSIKFGWNLFIKNWLISIEMAFILFFINFIVVLLWFLLVVAILVIPLLFLTFIFYKFHLIAAFWLMLIIILLFILISLALAAAVLTTFQISSWTTLTVELISRGGTSKITRVVSDFFGKK
ncbi:hypothetical protein CO115_04230 [Candidatus Falkowbacteria bacterium CG_4_9_14_3_um_filter_36_9]|nr:MAG: hypothetical protein COZ73_03220 [Candidatus Falkowbacteria bacterium CG_4_8_14_3_um_filter_36_11]PJA10083.1 MAG: hypothetical protein COX67_05555 [Candidatus Falkowbacteria bacterium CG_4_10_14_0_2_um_filter_36_22]PJB18575.1 MAG: hypothetical protein CO115_04230 [Candidatus Falkowbacteria bacterium CG_4_9_14_3_um_filter_36_9]